MGHGTYIPHIHKVSTVLQGGGGEEVNEIVTYIYSTLSVI